MKYFIIFLFAVFGIFTLMMLPFDDDYYLAYGMLTPLFPEELLEQSETILVGNITSKNVLQVEYSDKVMTDNNGSLKTVMQNFTNNVNEYTVKIEEFLKTPQDFHTVTVREPTAGEKFEVGDRVILYIPKLDEPNKYRFESFSLPESCDSQDALMQQRLWFTGREFNIMQNDIRFDGYKKKEFQNLMTNEPIRFEYAHDMQTMHGKSFDLEIEVFREDFDGFDYEQPAFNQTITAVSKPCEWIASAEWEFIPTQDGVYRIVGSAKTTGDEPSSDEMLFGNPIRVESSTNVTDLPPLKQIKSGVALVDIKCSEGKSPAYKYDRMRVACVSEETLSELWNRGWATMRFYTAEDTSPHALCNNYQGKWHPEHNGCRGDISDLQCSLMGGAFVDNLKICYNDICPENKTYTLCVVNSDEPESSDGVFYPRYHVSVFQNAKTTEQYVTPDFITIGPNSQVTWSNYDNVTVSLNSVDPDNMWGTSVIPPDGYDTVTFEETGIYEYKGNAGIHGFIVVMDDDGQLLESKFSEVFGNGSPLVYNDEMRPVFLYDNCNRYAYWLNAHGKEKITLPEDYPRYPPWGNQIFPLVEFCTSNGELVKTMSSNTIHWEFRIENEN